MSSDDAPCEGSRRGRIVSGGTNVSVRPIPGKGLGVVATAKIARGEPVLAEEPVFMLSAWQLHTAEKRGPDAQEALIRREVEALSESDRREFWALEDCHGLGGQKSAFGIWQTNAIATGTGSFDTCNGLYWMSCRFNHSCKPNVNRCWIESRQVEAFHASRDIPCGQELCTYYIDPKGTFAERQESLKFGFNFVCHCEVCSLKGEDRTLSDTLHKDYQELDNAIAAMADEPDEGLELVEGVLAIIDAEFDNDPHLLQRAYHDGFQMAALAGNTALAKDMMTKAWESKVVAEGDHEGTRLLKGYAEDIFTHPLLSGTRQDNIASTAAEKPCQVPHSEASTAAGALVDLCALD